MKLNLHYSEDRTSINIMVMGEVESKKDIETLLYIFDDPKISDYKITLLDAGILNANLVEKLDSLIKSKLCKIYVFKRYLYIYLHNLGVKCEYVSRQSLQSGCIKDSKPGELDEHDVLNFLNDINKVYGFDYTGYQMKSLKRRIKITMLRENVKCFNYFRKAVLEDMEIFEQLFLDFSINTTEFFRDPDVFCVLKGKILPYLNSHAHIKIWCVGCSTGKEPYSLAIFLDELGLLNKTYIYATDINPYIIEEAKNGLFSTSDIDKDIMNYKKAGGKKSFIEYFELKNTYMKVKDYLKKNILFFQHSIVSNGIINEFQMILCRNVFIYLNPQLQEKALTTFYNSLDKTGFLVLGKSEGLNLNRGYSFFVRFMDKEKIYRPKAT